MRRFLLKAILFALPFLLYAGAVVVIDPYERFGLSHAVPHASKEQAAAVYDHPLWKVVAASHRREENILLGGSKMGLLKPALLKDATGLDYADLTIGGATAVEAIHMFWIAVKGPPLRRVAIGLGLESLNGHNDRDRVLGAARTAESPLLYLTNRDVLLASAHLFAATYLGAHLASAAPDMKKDAFWRAQLGEGFDRVFARFELDEAALGELAGIAAYCREHQIELTFLVLPSHADVHERIRAAGLEAAWRALPARLAALAPTVDLDVDDATTRDRARFTDPFHFDHEVAAEIVRRGWAPTSSTPRRIE